MKKVFQIKLKNITKLLAVVIVASLATFTGCKSYDEDITKLNTDIATLKTDLTKQITDLNTATVAASDAKIASLTAEINSLKTKVTTLETTGATDAEVAAVKADILSKTASLEAFNAYKASNDAAIAALTTKVNAAATQVALTALQTELNGKILEVSNTLKALGASVDGMKVTLDKAVSDLSKLSGTVGTTVTDLATLKADVNTRLALLEGLLKIQQGKSTVLDGFTNQLTTQLDAINKNSGDITKLKTDLTNQLNAIDVAYKAADAALKAELLAAIKTTDDNLAAAKTAINADITALKADVQALKDKDASLSSTLSAVSTKLDALQNTVNAYVLSNDAAVKALKDASTATNTALTDAVSAINAKIVLINANLKAIANAINVNFDALSSRLTSLVFIPELHVNGIQAMNFSTISYSPCGSATYKFVSPKYRVSYHVNPSFITEADIDTKNLSFVVQKSTNVITTFMAAPAAETRISATYVSLVNGILTVDVLVADFEALLGTAVNNQTTLVNSATSFTTTEKFNMVALQVPLSDKAVADNKLSFDDATNTVSVGTATYPASRIVTSDYARLYYVNMVAPTDVYLSKKGIAAPASKLALTEAAAKAQAVDGVDGAVTNDPLVFELPYGSSINLVDNIEIYNAVNPISTERYGLSYKFDLLDANGSPIVYNRGVNSSTDQQQFITIQDAAKGKIVAKTYSIPDIIAAQGRTPIVRVRVFSDKDASCAVLTAFVKIHLSEKPDAPAITINPNPFKFTTVADPECGDYTAQITVNNMNENVYTQAGLNKTSFHALYTTFTTSGDGILVQATDPQEVDSHVINWTLSNAYIWSKLYTATGGTYTFKAQAVYKSSVPQEHGNVIINLEKTFTISSINIPQSQLITNYWYGNYSYVKHNITVPDNGATTTVGANSFANNLNQAFEQTSTFALKAMTKNYNYFFTTSQPAISNGTGSVTLVPSADGQTLRVGSAVGEIVAMINPYVSGIGDVLQLNQSSATAKLLLNVATENLKVRIGIRTVWCNTNPQYTRKVTINGNNSFDVVFVRPINPQPAADQHFVDGLNLGDQYTYLEIAKLTNLNDWRFSDPVASFATHDNYYLYYGITNITADVANVQTDLNQAPGVRVPKTQYPDLQVFNAMFLPGVTNPATNFYGYITYKNTGNVLGVQFNLYVPVTITYAWGSIQSAVVTVPVWKTVGGSGIKRK